MQKEKLNRPELPADIVRLRGMWTVAHLSHQHRSGWGNEMLQPCLLCQSEDLATRTCALCYLSLHRRCCDTLNKANTAQAQPLETKISGKAILPETFASICDLEMESAAFQGPLCPLCKAAVTTVTPPVSAPAPSISSSSSDFDGSCRTDTTGRQVGEESAEADGNLPQPQEPTSQPARQPAHPPHATSQLAHQPHVSTVQPRPASQPARPARSHVRREAPRGSVRL
jgi:hypothetical protein